MNDELPDTPTGEFLLYTTEDGKARVECRFENETLWLSQALMAELFETTPQNIPLHLKALYEDGEIDPEATCKDYLQVRSEGERQIRRQPNATHWLERGTFSDKLTPTIPREGLRVFPKTSNLQSSY